MSFWKGVMNAFGFGGESEEDDEEYDSSLPTYAAQPRVMSPKPTPTTPSAANTAREGQTSDGDAAASDATPATNDNHSDGEAVKTQADVTSADPELPGDLFDAIIEQFNAAQPDFISRCLSIDAQRAYLLNSLSENLRARLDRAISHSCSSAASDAQAADAERERLQRRINAIEADNKNTESLRQENRKLHLSIERQKRALLDRINDLEAQVAKSHAEREKFFSDKRNPADAALIDSSNSRIKELEQQLADKGKEMEETEQKLTEKSKEAEELTAKIAEMERSMANSEADSTGHEKELAERDGRIAELTARLAEQSTLREQLEVKTRMSDEMINDLRNQAAAARNEYEDTCRQQQMALEQIHDQVVSFEQIKAKLESRITELKEALKEEKRADRDALIARLNEENASLRHTIENNLYNQANSEARLRSEIKQLKRELEQARSSAKSATASPAERYGESEAIPSPDAFLAEPQPTKPASKRRGRPKKVKLDDDLDNTEWFSSQHKDDPDFGYHEPPRRPSNDNAAQLSLF